MDIILQAPYNKIMSIWTHVWILQVIIKKFHSKRVGAPFQSIAQQQQKSLGKNALV